jgi:hypothetical protein
MAHMVEHVFVAGNGRIRPLFRAEHATSPQ